MKRITYANSALCVEDDTAAALIEYAQLLVLHGESDIVTVCALGAHGNVVDATLLLTPASSLMIESAESPVVPPANHELTARLRERIRAFSPRDADLADLDGENDCM